MYVVSLSLHVDQLYTYEQFCKTVHQWVIRIFKSGFPCDVFFFYASSNTFTISEIRTANFDFFLGNEIIQKGCKQNEIKICSSLFIGPVNVLLCALQLFFLNQSNLFSDEMWKNLSSGNCSQLPFVFFPKYTQTGFPKFIPSYKFYQK